MDQFDYDVVEYNIQDVEKYKSDLRRAGREGWDLVAIIPLSTNGLIAGVTTKIQATFKRKIPTQRQP